MSKHICKHPGCGALIPAAGLCDKHKKTAGWYRTSVKSTTDRGYGWQWQKLRKEILLRDCGLCQVCLTAKRIKKAAHVDHVISKAEKGTDDPSNLRAICEDCHKDKTQQDRWAKK